MKYLLLMHMNPTVWEGLSRDEKEAVYAGHADFQRLLRESGELLMTQALAEPEQASSVRVRDEALDVTDGPYLEAKEFLAGYYLVECESKGRAVELAAKIPDAKYTGVEVREIVFEAGPES